MGAPAPDGFGRIASVTTGADRRLVAVVPGLCCVDDEAPSIRGGLLAWEALAGAWDQFPRARTLGPRAGTWIQLACGVLSLAVAATCLTGTRWARPRGVGRVSGPHGRAFGAGVGPSHARDGVGVRRLRPLQGMGRPPGLPGLRRSLTLAGPRRRYLIPWSRGARVCASRDPSP